MTAPHVDVEDASSASDALVLVRVSDPVQPQQSQPSLASQDATFPLSSASPLSTPSSFDTWSTYSQIVPCPQLVLIESPSPPSSSSSSTPSARISQVGSNVRVDPLLRVAKVRILLRPAKVVSLRRPSLV